MGHHTTMNAKPYIPQSGRIIYSTEAKGLASHARAVARQTPAELKAAAEMMAVVKAQPHRMGSDDFRLSEPLGRFVASHRLRSECYDAGNRYAEIVKEAKSAMGFDVAGWAPGGQGDCALTDAQLQARKDLAVGRRREADDVLARLMPRLPRVMEKFAYDQIEPSIYDHDLLRDGLVLLADHFGMLDRGINRDSIAYK